MDYDKLCASTQKIDSKVRFAGVINSRGRLIAGGMVESKTRLGDRKRDEMLPMKNDIMMVSMERKTQFEKIASSILKLIEKL